MQYKLNILQTVSGLRNDSGGSRHFPTSLSEALGRLGHKIHLISQDDAPSGDTCEVPDPKFVTTHLLKLTVRSKRLKFYYSVRFSKTVERTCSSEKIQIVHDHGLWLPSNHSSAAVSRRLGIPLVIHPHGMLEKNALEVHSWKKALAWGIYQKKDFDKATIFVATSQGEARTIRSLGFGQPVAVIPIGVDLPDLERQTQNRQVRQALFLSRIHPIKGLTDLVDAWAKVRPPNWKMVIAGPDEENHRSEIERAVANLGLSDCFIFKGPVYGKLKADLFNESDLFVLPSKSENFGLVIAEALSYGIPVITTDRTPWESLVSKQCGWWVEKTVDALAEAISDATSLSDAERKKMGSRGRDFVESEFSWPMVADKMIMAYQWVLGKSPQPKFII